MEKFHAINNVSLGSSRRNRANKESVEKSGHVFV